MKKLLIYALLLALMPAWAQAQSASERRAARQKNEANMKDFESDDPLFKKVQIPEKWLNRSAVVIAERVEFEYGGSSGGSITGKVRRQVKLLDQAAIEEFGKITYEEDDDNRTGIQIIKANGKRVPIDMSAATPFKEEANDSRVRRWNTYVRGGANTRKVALPGLEVGDIVDIVTEIKGNFSTVFYPACSDIMDIPFAEEYPVMKRNVQFTVRRGTAISAVSLNGAPKLKLISEPKGRFQTYLAVGEMMEDDTLQNRYAFAHRTIPRLKFQICVTGGSDRMWDQFAGAPGEIKNRIEDEEIQQVMFNAFNYRLNNQQTKIGNTYYTRYQWRNVGRGYTSTYESWLGRYFRGETDPVKVADALYYKMRYDFMYGEYAHNAEAMNDELFSTIFISVLKKLNKNWDVQLAVAPGRQLTDRKAMISRNELYWFAYVAHKGKKHFYYTVTNHRKPGDEFYRLAGVEAYIVYVNKKEAKGKTVQKFRIPEMDPTASGQSYSSDITINENNELIFDSKVSFRGTSRLMFGDMFLTNTDFSKQDLELISTASKESTKKSASDARKEKRADVSKKFDSEEDEKKKIERLKSRASRNFNVVSYDGYKIEQTGRYPNESELVVSEKFTASDLVAKAGKNLIVSVGLFTGNYTRIDTTVQRMHGISLDYPMSNRLEYRLQIPAGYQAEGVEALNMEVTNNAGQFKSTATVEGGVVKIVVERKINKAEMPVSDWSDFTKFTNAASDFNQKKLVLKKL